jgi:membrane protease YdiL (CAAX protease family)
MMKQSQTDTPEPFFDVQWTIKDVAGVAICLFVAILVVPLPLALFCESKGSIRLLRFIEPILLACVPILWVKKRYGLTEDALGLRKGTAGFAAYFILGMLLALGYSLLIHLTPLRDILVSPNIRATVEAVWQAQSALHHLLFLPLVILGSGFPLIVLTPIGEEILFRGFLYVYFRRKVGILLGLFFQGLIFSLLHFDYIRANAILLIAHRFLIGLLCGLLYEKTRSLYPSIIFHGMFSYLNLLFLGTIK